MSDTNLKHSEPGRRLLHYWAHGEGRAKWIDKPHPYAALVKALREAGVPEYSVHGLAANIMQEATGVYPGQRPGVNHGHKGH